MSIGTQGMCSWNSMHGSNYYLFTCQWNEWWQRAQFYWDRTLSCFYIFINL